MEQKRINGLVDEHLYDWVSEESKREKRSMIKTITIALERYREWRSKPIRNNKPKSQPFDTHSANT